MDKHEICTIGDAPLLATLLKGGENVLFSYSPDEINAYIILICPDFTTVGKMLFGGIPHGFYVGITFKGAFHFDLSTDLYADYVGEKLNLSRLDSEYLTQMLNAIGKEYYGK